MDDEHPPEAPSHDRWPVRVRRSFHELPPLGLREHGRLAVHLGRWALLGGVVGVLAGVSAWALLGALTWATELRLENPSLLFLLPAAGFVVGYGYYRLAGRAIAGNNLLLDEIHSPSDWVPRRMAPLIFVATIVTQIFGGSAGREGTALQMAGSLTDWFSRVVRLDPDDRRTMLIAALSGGFGAMFGVPMAGAVFGMEVQSVGRLRYEALVPALTASVVGNQVTRALGGEHAEPITLTPQIDAALLLKVTVAGVLFAIAGAAFIELTHVIKKVVGAAIPWPPARPILGGIVIIAIVLALGEHGRDYVGLSLPLAASALGGGDVGMSVFALKLLLTSITLGTGFQGGEVTPLFVIGATLGAGLAPFFGMPVAVLAAVGYVAVFAGSANTPLTCTIMGVELFGSAMVVPIAIGCIVSYVLSSHRSIYDRQRIAEAKGEEEAFEGETIAQYRGRQRRPRSTGPA